MKKTAVAGLFLALAGSAFAQQGAVPKDIPHLDHVFYIMMENHGYREIINNPNARSSIVTRQVRTWQRITTASDTRA